MNRSVARYLKRRQAAALQSARRGEKESAGVILAGCIGQEMAMLNDKEAIVTIAVKDLNAARRFYEETVELKPSNDAEPGSLAYKCGNARVFIYESRYAGTNQATAATWIVGTDLDKIVDALSAKGVPFEHYDDLPNTKREGHIHVVGHLRLAWFKDPDGNILALASG